MDDFGSGYSSFNILKTIQFDELKLDRFFISEGYNKEHDEKLFKTVVDLGKSFGMRVIQEGVETKEMLEKVIEYGCDGVQGFYYAKPISMEEYKIFLKSNTSMRYKSKVI